MSSDSESSSSSSSSAASSDSGSPPASPPAADRPASPSGSRSPSPASNKSSSPEAPKPSSSKATARRRRASSSDDEHNKYRHHFDDEQEYRAWLEKSEKEREQILFEKQEEEQYRKNRQEIEQRLAARTAEGKKKKKRSSDSDSDAEIARPSKADSDSDMDVEYHQPSELDRKRKHNQAMSDLLQKRKVNQQKETAKQSVLSIDDFFGKDENVSDNESSSSSSSSSRSSRSSSSSRESSPGRQSDEEAAAEQHPVEQVYQLNKARISRHKIHYFIHRPYFKDIMVGSFVRIQTGPIADSSNRYHIARVIDVCEMPKPYLLQDTKTNRGIKIKFGRHEKAYRAEYVSNTQFEPSEFQEWLDVTAREDEVPTVEHCEAKEKQIKEALNRRHTDHEVEQTVAERKKFNKVSRNFAMEKGELMKKKEGAEQRGDIAAAQDFQRQIEAIEAEADELEKARSASTRAVLWINQRNRNKMKEHFLGDKAITQDESADDPFTRKKERMKVVSGRGALSANNTNSNITEAPKPTTASVTTSEPAAKRKNLFELASSIPAPKIDIDFSRLSSVVDRKRQEAFAESTPIITPSLPTSGRQITLEEYRRRRANKLAANAEPSTSQG